MEEQLPQWGRDLYKAALEAPAAQEALTGWRSAADNAERRFSVLVDSALPQGASQKKQAAANEAAGDLLSLPWEIMHDGRGYLFQGGAHRPGAPPPAQPASAAGR